MPDRLRQRIKGMPLLHFTLLLSVGYLVVSLLFIIAISSSVRQKAIEDLSQEDARQTAELIFQSLYSVMANGWDKAAIEQAIQRLNDTSPKMEIAAYRGAPVIRQFGDIPGENAIRKNDPAIQRALEEGQEILRVSDTTIRFIYPIVVKRECLRCHTQARVGDINGAIDIHYPIENLKISLNLIINIMLGYIILIMLGLFAALFYKLRTFVVKPVTGLARVMSEITLDGDLSRRVNHSGWIREIHQLTEYFNRMLGTLQDFQYRLQELSSRDPLTNLYNRRSYERFLEYEVDRTSRHNRSFCLIMVDLDNFKQINDTYGHAIGDLTLQKLALILEKLTRKTDILARLGGDEFVVILPETDLEQGLLFAEKLRDTVTHSILDLPDCKIRLSGSFGVVSYPENGDGVENLNIAMDVAMYKAKHSGKNCVATLAGNERGAEMEVFKKGEFLRLALEEKRIVAYLQPIVKVSGPIYAYEVLARIKDDGGIIEAADFIHASEELGLTVDLDLQVFKKGLEFLANPASPPVRLFFKLSLHTLASEETIYSMIDTAIEMQVAPESIVFEITEREALPRISELSHLIDELHEIGVRFALDSFGNGFSSFLYLKYLSFDYVKIEGSLIRQIAVDRRDRIIVEHIASIANQYGIQTIAEMVEDGETEQLLRDYGITYAQGYYYGHPKPSMASLAQGSYQLTPLVENPAPGTTAEQEKDR